MSNLRKHKEPTVSKDNLCVCGSDIQFTDCCELIHKDHKQALNAVQLMRARYSAYVLGNIDFIVNTHHASTRPSNEGKQIKAATQLAWCKLEIISSDAQPESKSAFVEFKAWYLENKQLNLLHENSRFMRDNCCNSSALNHQSAEECWYYVDGQFIEEKEENNRLKPLTIARNSSCPCGSGKKFKRCCGP